MKKTAFGTNEERWKAVAEREKRVDFVYAVSTTGVYCRPSCGARLPRRENVSFYDAPAEAERAGFRPCKRCRPTNEANEHAMAVAKACELLREENAPDLTALAAAVRMSPSHFHRLFKSMIGVTPKAYAAEQRSRRVRDELRARGSVTAAIYNAGFNSNGRFYAKSTKLLGMKPKEFRARGEGMKIQFAVAESSLGSVLVAATATGVCAVTLGDHPEELVRALQDFFPRAELAGGNKEFEKLVATVIAFVERPTAGLDLPLDVQGTAFQMRVWQKLREIPCGQTRSYAELARELGVPNATRAVAGACAANRIAVAIPCHRVVRTDGALSGYRWGVARKARLLELEGSKIKAS